MNPKDTRLEDILHKMHIWSDGYIDEEDYEQATVVILSLFESLIPEKKKYTHKADEHYFRKVGFNKCRQQILDKLERLKK